MHRHTHKDGKSTLPLSHKNTRCNDYLPCHSGAICCFHKADYLTPTAGCVCGFAIFSQMPTLLFVEMLPSWHKLKYVCVCVDVCVWVSVCSRARLCVHVVCVWWVGGCLCGMEGCKNGGMDDTNRAEWWEAGVRALLPLPGWMQYLTADWESASPLFTQSHQKVRTSISTALWMPPILSYCCRASIRPLDAHLAVLDHISQVEM